MEEIWKDIEGYEGLYQVSNLGRVKSLDKQKEMPNGAIYTRKGKILRQYVDSTKKYWIVNLYKNHKQTTKYVHRLVALAFVPNPENKPQVSHKDERNLKNAETCNNSADNLEWATSEENNNMPQRRSKFLGKNNPMYGVHITGKSHHNAKRIKCNGIVYDTVYECAQAIGVNKRTVWKWAKRKDGCPDKYGVYEIEYV